MIGKFFDSYVLSRGDGVRNVAYETCVGGAHFDHLIMEFVDARGEVENASELGFVSARPCDGTCMVGTPIGSALYDSEDLLEITMLFRAAGLLHLFDAHALCDGAEEMLALIATDATQVEAALSEIEFEIIEEETFDPTDYARSVWND